MCMVGKLKFSFISKGILFELFEGTIVTAQQHLTLI